MWKRYFIISGFIIGTFLILSEGGSVDKIPKNTVKADLQIKFLKLEKDEKNKEPLPLKQDAIDFDHPWIQSKAKDVIAQYSMERKIRIDFKLKNVYFQNLTQDKDSKCEYSIFSVKWPIFSMEVINKRLRKGMYQTYSWISSKNSKVLVEGLGYYFLQNQLLSDWYGDKNQIQETREIDNLVIRVLDQKMTLESVIKTDKPLPTESPYNLEGYCVYGGSLIASQRNWRWYPFDTYQAKLYISFPFEETDLRLSIGQLDDFEAKVISREKKELENFTVAKDKEECIDILLKRKKYTFYFGILFSLFIALLPTFFPVLGKIVLARWIVYVAALGGMFFSTIPPDNIVWFFPMRFGLFLSAGIYIIINEYLYWIREFLNK